MCVFAAFAVVVESTTYDYDFKQFIGTACPDDDQVADYSGVSGDCYPCAEDALCDTIRVDCTDGGEEYTIHAHSTDDCSGTPTNVITNGESGSCEFDATLTYSFIVTCYKDDGSSKKDDDDDNECFHGEELVTAEGGVSKPIAEVQVGDRIQIMKPDSSFAFSDVVFVPHKSNMKKATFVELETEAGRSIKVTPEHLLHCGACDDSVTNSDAVFELTRANEIAIGACLHTVEGAEKVVKSSTVQDKGIYTVVAADPHGHIVVNGVVASSFGTSHLVPNLYYSLHRALYQVLPQWVLHSESLQAVNMLIGGLFISASAAFRK